MISVSMRRRRGAALFALGAAACGTPSAAPGSPSNAGAALAAGEGSFLQVRDQRDAMTIARARGLKVVESGESLAAMERGYPATRRRLDSLLDKVDSTALDTVDRRALRTMRAAAAGDLASAGESPGNAASEGARPDCAYDAAAIAALPNGLDSLAKRIYPCYGYQAQHVMVAAERLDRLTVLGRLSTTESAAERQRLFLALEPVFHSMNGDDGAGSPYRQLVRLSAARWRARGSPVDEAARAAGIDPSRIEPWLVAMLERWRDVMADPPMEPWDFDYAAGAVERRLDKRVEALGLTTINRTYYHALGADIDSLQVRYDLAPRDGKDPVAFTDFGRRAKQTASRWEPGDEWVIATYRAANLDNLAELMHETGHGIHIAAIRARPAFQDWPDDDAFTEGVADIASLEVDEPAWQQRWLGDSATLAENLRGRYAALMMDVCWSLFEIRMHAKPESDPNAVWTQLTAEYLHIRPHPELSWWARRGQLIDLPGYMSNYAIGGIIIADIRARLKKEHGDYSLGDPTWYGWVSPRLYRYGLARSSKQVIEEFLGRPLSPDALLADLDRLRGARGAGATRD